MRAPAFFCLFLIGALACARPPAALPVDECTLQTPLVPGVPGSPGHLIPSELRSEGASELATLMRTMKSDLEAARGSIEAGQRIPPMYARHRKLRCAWPTGLEDRNPVFEASAIAYLQLVRALDEKPADLRTAYEGVVTGCLACHATSCPGPITAIEKLRMTPR